MPLKINVPKVHSDAIEELHSKIKVLHDAIEEPFCLNGFIRTFDIWRTFLFHKRFFVAKEGSSDYKKVRKRWFFKEPLTEMVLCGTKMVLWHRCEEPLKHLYF